MRNVFLVFVIMAIGSPVFALEESQKVVMYWDSLHSFSKNEHSLANWLEGKTANAFINSKGEIEMTLDIAGFPHVLSSPELDLDCDSFDAIKITYLNLLDYAQGKNVRVQVGWLDEVMINKYRKNVWEQGEERFLIVPLERNASTTVNLQFLRKKNWRKGVKVVGLNLSVIPESDTIEGKLLISAIELVKFKN